LKLRLESIHLHRPEFDIPQHELGIAWNTRQSIQNSEIEKMIDHLERVRQIDMINSVDDGSSDIDTGRQYAINKLKQLINKEA
jgi:hypothetical protein